MEIKNKLILLALVIFTGCTSNPFWSDSPSKKINIQGYVFKKDSVSNVPVFVFVDGLGLSTSTDENGFYSINLPSLEMENGNFSGSLKIYYYIHNYKVSHSTLFITNGRLTSAQTDFDENGALLEPVRLEKIMSLDISIDNFWNRSSADTLKFSLDLVSYNYPISFHSYVDVLSNPRRYVPAGLLLESVQNKSVYYDENGVDFVQVTDMEANQNIQLNYEIAPNGFLPFIIDDYISLDEQLVQNGAHEIWPYIFIIQEDVPEEIYSVMGLQTIESISVDYLKIPIDIVSKTIFIQ